MKRSDTFALAALLCAALSGCGKEAAESPAPNPPKLKDDTLAYEPGDKRLADLGSGAVTARAAVIERWQGRLDWDEIKTVRVYSPVIGRITALRAKIGDRVTPGAPLAELTSADYSQAVADLAKARADLVFSDRTFSRNKDLFAIGAVARKDLEAAEADYGEKNAEVRRASDRLETLNVREGDSPSVYTLRAPIAGRIVGVTVNVGQEVRPDQPQSNVPRYAEPSFVISDPALLWLTLEVPEERLSHYREGQPVTIRDRASQRVFEATVAGVDVGLDQTTGHGRVRCTVDNAHGLLRAGMVVQAELATASENNSAGALVPAVAVVGMEGSRHVYLKTGDGSFRRVPVEAALGESPAGLAAVRGELPPGSVVVTTGSILLDAAYEEAESK